MPTKANAYLGVTQTKRTVNITNASKGAPRKKRDKSASTRNADAPTKNAAAVTKKSEDAGKRKAAAVEVAGR